MSRVSRSKRPATPKKATPRAPSASKKPATVAKSKEIAWRPVINVTDRNGPAHVSSERSREIDTSFNNLMNRSWGGGFGGGGRSSNR